MEQERLKDLLNTLTKGCESDESESTNSDVRVALQHLHVRVLSPISLGPDGDKDKGTTMRRRLGKQEGVRATFRGTFERSGTKPGWRSVEITMLFTDITDADGNPVCEHLWLNYTAGFARLSPWKPGDVVEFDARVKSYVKGYMGHRVDVYRPIEKDYKLSHPTRIKKIPHSHSCNFHSGD